MTVQYSDARVDQRKREREREREREMLHEIWISEKHPFLV
jgi:hypothetical protein